MGVGGWNLGAVHLALLWRQDASLHQIVDRSMHIGRRPAKLHQQARNSLGGVVVGFDAIFKPLGAEFFLRLVSITELLLQFRNVSAVACVCHALEESSAVQRSAFGVSFVEVAQRGLLLDGLLLELVVDGSGVGLSG